MCVSAATLNCVTICHSVFIVLQVCFGATKCGLDLAQFPSIRGGIHCRSYYARLALCLSKYFNWNGVASPLPIIQSHGNVEKPPKFTDTAWIRQCKCLTQYAVWAEQVSIVYFAGNAQHSACSNIAYCRLYNINQSNFLWTTVVRLLHTFVGAHDSRWVRNIITSPSIGNVVLSSAQHKPKILHRADISTFIISQNIAEHARKRHTDFF